MQLRSILKHLDLCIRVSFSCNKHQDFISHFGYKPKNIFTCFWFLPWEWIKHGLTSSPMWIVRMNETLMGLKWRVWTGAWCITIFKVTCLLFSLVFAFIPPYCYWYAFFLLFGSDILWTEEPGSQYVGRMGSEYEAKSNGEYNLRALDPQWGCFAHLLVQVVLARQACWWVEVGI